MNLLQMMQFVQGNIATSSDLPFAGPSTVVGVTGQYLEFYNFIVQAYKDIQIDDDNWNFRTARGTLNLFPGQWIYTPTQIRAQIPDYANMLHLHFIDDCRYTLIGDVQLANPTATVSTTAVTLAFATYSFTVANISDFSDNNGNGYPVKITDGTNTLTGPIQSIFNNTISLAAENCTVTGTPTVIPIGSPVTYNTTLPAGNVASQRFCFYWPYQDWRGWKDRQQLPKGTPTYYSEYTNDSAAFNPIPDKNYAWYFDYKTQLDVISQVDTWTPKYMPAPYHEAICWKAIMYWAYSRENGAKFQVASNEFERIMNKLKFKDLPDLQPYFFEFYG